MGVFVIVACSLLLSFGAAVGVNIQKLSMNKDEREGRNRSPLRQPLWCLGTAIVILDACGDFVFIGMAPQSLLAPLGSLSLGWNIILAPIFHPKEKVTRGIIGATAVIYIGTITTVLFAADSTPTYDLPEIIRLAQNPAFIQFFICSIVFEFCMFSHGSKNGFGILHYCSLAGCFGGQCILFAKSSSELVKNTVINGTYDDWTTSFVPYIFIVGMFFTVMTQMTFLNTGLAKFDALIVVPVFQSFWNAFSITGGLIFFQEYKYMERFNGVMYTVGIMITLIGVTSLVRQRSEDIIYGSVGKVKTSFMTGNGNGNATLPLHHGKNVKWQQLQTQSEKWKS